MGPIRMSPRQGVSPASPHMWRRMVRSEGNSGGQPTTRSRQPYLGGGKRPVLQVLRPLVRAHGPADTEGVAGGPRRLVHVGVHPRRTLGEVAMNAKPHSSQAPAVTGCRGGRVARIGAGPAVGGPAGSPGRAPTRRHPRLGVPAAGDLHVAGVDVQGLAGGDGRRPTSVAVLAAEGVRRRRPRRRDLDGERPDRARRAAGGLGRAGAVRRRQARPANWSSGPAGTAGRSGCCWARSAST